MFFLWNPTFELVASIFAHDSDFVVRRLTVNSAQKTDVLYLFVPFMHGQTKYDYSLIHGIHIQSRDASL